MTDTWFEGPAVIVIDGDRPGIPAIRSLEAAAIELLKWPESFRRDTARTLIHEAAMGRIPVARAEGAFVEAAKEAGTFLARSW